MTSSEILDVVVLGDGLVGLACARACASRGFKTTIVGRRRAGLGSAAAAGFLAPTIDPVRPARSRSPSRRARAIPRSSRSCRRPQVGASRSHSTASCASPPPIGRPPRWPPAPTPCRPGSRQEMSPSWSRRCTPRWARACIRTTGWSITSDSSWRSTKPWR
ncbi:MAG: FAD-dependent oxidoreductase [Gemmatimonadetes bacterium]|nr:FAD-dependent oxidoreductase [Gemmatimonadota bacterium]